MSEPFPHTPLRQRHAQTVRDSSSSYKIDYIIVIKNFLNPKGHQNPISGSKDMAILLKGMDLAYWWSCIGKGLRLQPAQQACLYNALIYCPYPLQGFLLVPCPARPPLPLCLPRHLHHPPLLSHEEGRSLTSSRLHPSLHHDLHPYFILTFILTCILTSS